MYRPCSSSGLWPASLPGDASRKLPSRRVDIRAWSFAGTAALPCWFAAETLADATFDVFVNSSFRYPLSQQLPRPKRAREARANSERHPPISETSRKSDPRNIDSKDVLKIIEDGPRRDHVGARTSPNSMESPSSQWAPESYIITSSPIRLGSCFTDRDPTAVARGESVRARPNLGGRAQLFCPASGQSHVGGLLR
jgi:hypothetical protein